MAHTHTASSITVIHDEEAGPAKQHVHRCTTFRPVRLDLCVQDTPEDHSVGIGIVPFKSDSSEGLVVTG